LREAIRRIARQVFAQFYQPPAFTGRTYARSGPSVGDPIEFRVATDRLVILQGLRGVGKTQLAIEYVHRNRSDYDVVWWIEATELQLAAQGLADLGASLGLTHGTGKLEEAVEAVRQWLTRNERWLLVFDNAPAVGPELIPPQIGGHILVTSHDPAWSGLGRVIPVIAFTRSEAVEALLRRTGQHDEKVAAQLAEALDDLPLALDLAASYVVTTGRSLRSFLDMLQNSETSVLEDAVPGAEGVFGGLKAALAAVADESPEAWTLLAVASFFAPQPIPLGLLFAGAPASVEGDKALLALRRSGIADVRDDALSVHPLVQGLVRESADEQRRRELVRDALGLAQRALLVAISHGIRMVPRSLIEHAIAAAAHAERLDFDAVAAAGRAEGLDYALVASSADLLLSAGEALRARSDYPRARATLERALTLVTAVSSDQGLRPFRTSLGGVLADVGEFDAAKEVLTLAALGGADPFALLALATVLRTTGDRHGAATHLQTVVGLLAKANDEVAVDARLDLAQVLRELGDLDGASAAIDDTRALARGERGGSSTGRILVELATLRQAQGDRSGAMAAAGQAVDTLSRTPPVGRDFGLITRAARVLADVDAMSQARVTLDKVLADLEALDWSSTPESADASAELGLILARLNDNTSARAAIERALAVDERIFGPDHPAVARDLAALAGVLDDPVDARAALERATWIAIVKFGPEHPTSVSYTRMLDELITKSAAGAGSDPSAPPELRTEHAR
jgi:tetratricopeptide (TPR) repeat protein